MKIFFFIGLFTLSVFSNDVPEKVKLEFARATLELKASGLVEKAVKEGQKIPDFHLNGKPIADYYSTGTVILKFYRGGWCSYCMTELQAYQKELQQISAKGAQLIALTPDTELEISKSKKKFSITFPIYSDAENLIAKKMGVAFKLDKIVGDLYKSFGINLEQSQGNKFGELPLPGTYIINNKGLIVYAFLDADYTKRADPKDVISKL